MAGKTRIEWATDTWNPITGCTKVSPGCDHCYAIGMARRIEAMQAGTARRIEVLERRTDAPRDYEGTTKHEYDAAGKLMPVDWTGRVNLLEHRLDQPIRWTKPRRIFVNSMSDLFHEQVPDEYIAQVFGIMALASWHTFQLLTKRHARMRSLLNREDFPRMVGFHAGNEPGTPISQWPLPNVWVGVSVENQQWADIRVPALLETPAAVRWLSLEPLLGPVSLAEWLTKRGRERAYPHHITICGAGQGGCFHPPCHCPCHKLPDTSLDWLVVGGESGTGARPMHPDWARSLRDQAQAAGVPFLFKQWGAWAPHKLDGGHISNVRMSQTRDQYDSIRWNPAGEHYVASEPDHPTRGYSSPGMATMLRVGKHKAGRELDGRTYDEYPQEASS